MFHNHSIRDIVDRAKPLAKLVVKGEQEQEDPLLSHDYASEKEEERAYDAVDEEEESEEKVTEDYEKLLMKKDKSIDMITDAMVLAFFLALPLKIVYYVYQLYYPDEFQNNTIQLVDFLIIRHNEQGQQQFLVKLTASPLTSLPSFQLRKGEIFKSRLVWPVRWRVGKHGALRTNTMN
eukprot:scaffold988_cov165-Ochromonas_danica.AAC.19